MRMLAAILLSAVAPMAAIVATPAVAAETAPAAAGKLTIDSAIEDIAANPKGKAALVANFPGLIDNPMYSSISSMTLKQLQPMAPDKMTEAQITKMSADLAKIK